MLCVQIIKFQNLVDRSNSIDITTTNVVEGVYIKPAPNRYAKWII